MTGARFPRIRRSELVQQPLPETLELPAAEARRATPDRVPLEQAPGAVEAKARRARILVVEDDAEMRAYLGEELSDEGYEVEGAPNAIEGLMSVMHDPPDVIVLDWKMPFLDGFEFLGSVTRCMPNTPVIFVTAYGRREISLKATSRGAFAFLPKPFPISRLLEEIASAIALTASNEPSVLNPVQAAPPPPEGFWCEECGTLEEVGRSSHCRQESRTK